MIHKISSQIAYPLIPAFVSTITGFQQTYAESGLRYSLNLTEYRPETQAPGVVVATHGQMSLDDGTSFAPVPSGMDASSTGANWWPNYSGAPSDSMTVPQLPVSAGHAAAGGAVSGSADMEVSGRDFYNNYPTNEFSPRAQHGTNHMPSISPCPGLNSYSASNSPSHACDVMRIGATLPSPSHGLSLSMTDDAGVARQSPFSFDASALSPRGVKREH